MRTPPHLVRPGLLVAGVALVLPACDSAGAGPEPVDSAPLGTAPPPGPVLCEFVPEASATTILGRDEVSGQGFVHPADGDSATTAQCRVLADGAPDPALTVTVLAAHSPEGEEVLRVIAQEDPDYLFPDAIGPGYGYRADSFRGANGVEGRGGAVTNVLWGDSRIQVVVNDHAAGRDAMSDAVALTRQVAAALAIPAAPSTPYPTP